jgi:hypothetical protein
VSSQASKAAPWDTHLSRRQQFENSRSVDDYPFVADGEIGAAVTL